MSSRFPPNSSADLRFPRDRTPPRALDRRLSNDAIARSNDQGYRTNDSHGYSSRVHEPAREPPRAPKALIDGPRGGGYIPRGRGVFLGRGDARDRDFRDSRDEPFPRRGRGQDRGSRDRFERRVSPSGRDRSRSPLSRDSRDIRHPRDYPPREDLRRDSGESLPPISADNFPRGRGGFRGRGRGRGDWDSHRGRGLFAEERDAYEPRSRSREREWERPVREERDRDFDSIRREDVLRREREDQDRDDRLRREPPPSRPRSRNSISDVPTPNISRSTSTTSVRLANADRFAQYSRDNRESFQEPRSRHAGFNAESKSWNGEKDQEKSDFPPLRRQTDSYERRTASPPPQAPPVPAFGSIPQRAPTTNQESSAKQSPPSSRSPSMHPARLGLLDSSRDAPSAPKAHSLSHAPTAPKAQQVQEKRMSMDTSDSSKRVLSNDENKFGSPRTIAGPATSTAKGAPSDQMRSGPKRFSYADPLTSPTRPSITPVHTAVDPTQPSVKKAVEEQGRNGNSAPTRQPLGDASNQSSPLKIPTGPRAERGPLSMRQAPAPTVRGPPMRGPSMIPRGGRGGGAWSWINPDLPKHTPRGPTQPSIMNVVPSKRDSIGEDKSKTGPPSAESAEHAIAKWRRANAPPGIAASQHPKKDTGPSQPSPGIMHRVPTTRDPIKEESSDTDESKDPGADVDDDKDGEESEEGAGEDAQLDLDEEDFAEAEKKFNRELQALEAKRPPSPRSNPELLMLLDELDALAAAIEQKSKTTSAGTEGSTAPVALGLPSPKADGSEAMDHKHDPPTSPVMLKFRPQTPPVKSLPFLNDGPPTPFAEIDDLQQDSPQRDAVESRLVERLKRRRDIVAEEEEDVRELFATTYRPWRMSVEDFEDEKRADEALADSSGADDMPLAPPLPSVVGRRGRVISELAMDEVLKISQETAAKEERVRREREAPVFLPAETFNPEREAIVPDMLDRFEARRRLYIDKNNYVDPIYALDALFFTPKQDDFTPAESEAFLYNYLLYPKRFGMIAAAIGSRDFRDCVQHYYLTKRLVKYKDQEAAFLKTKKGKRHVNQLRGQIRPRASGLMPTFDGVAEMEAQNIALTEKGRPRRAAAPTFGDVEPEPATPAATPARRGAAANKEIPNGTVSAEKPTARRTRAPNKEKPGRKPKAQLLAAAPGFSPQKSLPDSVRGVSKEPTVTQCSPRIDELDSAQVLAGLSSGQPYHLQIYPQTNPEAWPPSRPAPTSMDQIPQHVPPTTAEPLQPSQPPPHKPAGATQTSSYWSVPEQQDFHNLVRHFGTNWQAIASTMKTKTHIMVRLFHGSSGVCANLFIRSKISTAERLRKGHKDSSWSKKLSRLTLG